MSDATLPTPPGEVEARKRSREAFGPRVVGISTHVARSLRPETARAAAGRRPAARSRCASASLSPAATTSPLISSRTSPPAAAPTASLTITARPRFIASLTTRPHGSRNVRVAIDGTHEHVACRVDVAQLDRVDLAQADHPRVALAPGSVGCDRAEAPIDARQYQRRPLRRKLRRAPGVGEHREPLLALGRPTNRKRAAASAGQSRSRGASMLRRAPEVVVDGLRRDVHVARAACPHVGADVRAVRDDRVRRAIQAPQRQVAERVRGAARVRPQRGPQDQRHARASRAAPSRPAAPVARPVGQTTAR